MSSKQAMKLLNAIDRAKRQKSNKRILAAVRRERNAAYSVRGTPDNVKRFGADYASADLTQRKARSLLGYQGKGGYFMQKLFGAKKGGWLDRLGDVVTDTVLPIVPGGSIAQKAINIGGSVASRVFPLSGAGAYYGKGLYEPAANALMQIPADHGGASLVPSVTSTGSSDGSIIIKHKEYVSDIVASALGFNNESLVINPGLEQSFPWLSQVAANFTEYTMHQCIYTYKSAIAPIGASSTGQVGSLIMAAQYNVQDEPFSSKQAMLLESGSCADMLTRDMIFGIECDPAKLSASPGKYVRSSPVINNADASTYDHAKLNFATDAVPAGYLNQQVGELWVEYTVELRKPRLYTAAGNAISRDVIIQPGPGTVAGASNQWATPFYSPTAANLLRGQQNSIGITMSNTGNIVTFPDNYAGTVKCVLRLTSSSTFAGVWGALRAWQITEPTVVVDADTAGAALGTTNAIVPIYDIPGIFPTAPFVSMWATSQTLAGQLVNFTIEFHLRVALPKPGVRNAFKFITPLASTLASGSNALETATLEVEEYNTSLNYRGDGTNDAMMLVNGTGSLVTFVP